MTINLGIKNNKQKLCDIADWFNPEIDRVIRNELQAFPHFHRKQWEFAIIYLALEEAGVLNKNSTGIAFGAGKERLLYSVARRVKKLIATDLYNVDSVWEGTKTNDPKNYLLGNAPFKIDPDSLDAHYMDMKKIEYPDETFNFCYSSCVFEHISNNDRGFIKHLKEARRTLKEGGVYCLTTELTYEKDTLRLPGSFFFELNHLLDLVRQSGLHAAPVFDAELSRTAANEAAPLMDDFCFPFGKRWTPHVSCLRQGLTFTSCHLLLTKDSARSWQQPEIKGYDESRDFIQKTLQRNLKKIWKDWQCVSPARNKNDKPAVLGHEHFAATEPRKRSSLAFHTPYLRFGQSATEFSIDLIPADKNTLTISVVSCDKNLQDRRIECRQKLSLKPKQGEQIKMAFVARDDRTYAVMARGKGSFHSINIKARHQPQK